MANDQVPSFVVTTIRQPSKSKIEDLLGGTGSRVEIPSYQRSYSWSPDEANDLYSDIDRFQKRYPGDQIDKEEYFLGSIVTIKDGRVFRLLDGQQRMATITILLSAIRDRLQDVDPESAQELHKSLIQERPKPAQELRNRLTLSVYDQEFFNAFIQRFPRDHKATIERASHRQIKRVREFFDTRLTSDLKDLSVGEQTTWLFRLWTIISACLVLVVVEAANDEDATEVFEVLNERGVGLTTIDLLRNFLLGTASSADEREVIVLAWGEVFSVSDNPARVQNFLRHYWISRHGDVKSRGLYREIKDRLKRDFFAKDLTPVKFSIDLSTSAETYRSLLAPPSTDSQDLNEVLEAVGKVGATPLYPAILSALEVLGEKAAVRVTRALLAHYVRWTIVGKRESTDLEEQVFKLAVDVSNGLGVQEVLDRLMAASLSDSEFEVAFEVATLTKPGHRRHVLEAIEKHMRTVGEQDEVEPKKASELHVEHIYPQTPTLESKLDDHDDWVQRIGNLTLLSKRWNTKIKNGDFLTVKRPEISKSVIMLNDSVKTADTWGREEISARQKQLAKLAPAVWRLPPD